MQISDALEYLAGGGDLDSAQAEAVMEQILAGGATDAQIAGLLVALRVKGETVAELVGFARAMRRNARPVFAPGRRPAAESIVDTCGTGGDRSGTFNISTAAALVVAGAGVRVAKHGNRSISSRCGSADVLEALGVRPEHEIELAGRAIEQVGIGFLFAPAVHPAMKHAMRARRELRLRTVFNLLGPLTNPAGASAQLVGVFSADFAERVAQALGELGARRAFVVHGREGLDEISLSGATFVAELAAGKVRAYEVTPEDFGLRRAPLEELAGGDAARNAEIIRHVLAGQAGPPRDAVLANAAAALVAAGRAEGFREGVAVAAQSIDSGAAAEKLEALIRFLAADEGPSQHRSG
ncbi:MAG TPA: anthranilate phosphoribosyltransferase [Candidatus Dormibacteraeota bacterium]|nr:anthranilate phosphoribosyltransferase [Candidatus Dormibacteraeota bacterium]